MEFRTKKIQALLPQFTDEELFIAISQGLEKVLSNANSICNDSMLLGEHDRISGQNIFFLLAEEEAGKFLLLLDTARCPRSQLNKHLSGFNSHIAKGIYAFSSYWQVGNFEEVKDAVDNYFKQKFLINFEDDEGAWIAQNPLETSRELAYYVDYIVTKTGQQIWTNPSEDLYLSTGLESKRQGFQTPEALELANAIFELGLTKSDSLAIIADIWRPLQTKDFHFYEPDLRELIEKTLLELDKNGLLNKQPENVYRLIFSGWSFPMHSLKLADKIKSNLNDLRDQVNEINKTLLQ